MIVRTRFAPSPTGDLHVGSVRTALYNYLFAKHHQGEFLLRIEDTDQARSTQESIDIIYAGLAWLGLDYPKEKIIHQMDKLERYQHLAQQLIEKNQAYYCDCSKERLEKLRAEQLANKEKPRYDGCCRDRQLKAEKNHVIRLANPRVGQVIVKDLIHGEIIINNSELDDLVLIRSDGVPTYNFSVVVDDSDQKITHVIRGDDHLNNTPRQINIYQALGLDLPQFAHIPMILDNSGKKMSKRDNAASILYYQKIGILPEALLNYLVRLGWSSGDKEIFSLSEMIRDFNLAGVNVSGAKFDLEKLLWLNQHYIKNTSDEKLSKLLKITNLKIIQEYKTRVNTLEELKQASQIYLDPGFEIKYNSENLQKFYNKSLLKIILERFKAIANSAWQAENLQEIIKDIAKQENLKFPQLAQLLRIAITGDVHSPGIGMTLELAGQDISLLRIQRLIEN